MGSLLDALADEAQPRRSLREQLADEPSDVGFLDALGDVPGQLGRILAGVTSPGISGDMIAAHARDVALAREGDREAAKRARAFGLIASTAGSILPGGPELAMGRQLLPGLAARAGLGALGGGAAAGIEAAVEGTPVPPAALTGAIGGAILNPLAGAAGASLKLAAVRRLQRAGKPIPARLAAEVQQELAPARSLGDPVARITQALRDVPDLRGQQEALYSAERGRRIAAFRATTTERSGEAGFRAGLSHMAGEMEKVPFGSLRPLVGQQDVDALFDLVKDSPNLSDFERLRTGATLLKLLQPEGVKLPTDSELVLLERAFGSKGQQLVRTLLEKRPQLSRLQRVGVELVAAPRALQASMDLSAPLRQGLFAGAGFPRQWAGAFKAMVTDFRTEQGAQRFYQQLVKRPTYDTMRRAGLAITSPGSVLGEGEEAFASSFLVNKLPGIRFSERTYSGFLNKLRADVFDSLAADAHRSGLGLDDERARAIAGFINAATGRGNLPKSLIPHAQTLNAVLFSPRLMASRLQLLNPALYVRSDPVVRKAAIRSALALGSLASTMLALAKLGGADVETDPLSSDWAKVKIGNTRYDLLGGFQQYLRLGARMAQGFASGADFSEKVTGAAGPTAHFVRSKLAPIPSLIADLTAGTDAVGRKVEVPAAVMSRFTPLILQDTYDAVQEWGWLGVPMSAPSVFGVGVSTYNR